MSQYVSHLHIQKEFIHIHIMFNHRCLLGPCVYKQLPNLWHLAPSGQILHWGPLSYTAAHLYTHNCHGNLWHLTPSSQILHWGSLSCTAAHLYTQNCHGSANQVLNHYKVGFLPSPSNFLTFWNNGGHLGFLKKYPYLSHF